MKKTTKRKLSNKEKFAIWMKEKVKSNFWTDNERMVIAFERIIEY
jgi:hypothetical protein